MHTRANETRAFYDTTVDRNKSLLLVTWPRIALFLRWCRTASLAEQQVRNRFDLEEQDRIFSCKENALYGFRPRCWTCEQLNTPFPVINQAKPILMAVALATFDCRLFAKTQYKAISWLHGRKPKRFYGIHFQQSGLVRLVCENMQQVCLFVCLLSFFFCWA